MPVIARSAALGVQPSWPGLIPGLSPDTAKTPIYAPLTRKDRGGASQPPTARVHRCDPNLKPAWRATHPTRVTPIKAGNHSCATFVCSAVVDGGRCGTRKDSGKLRPCGDRPCRGYIASTCSSQAPRTKLATSKPPSSAQRMRNTRVPCHTSSPYGRSGCVCWRSIARR